MECVLKIILPLAVGAASSGLFVNLREVFDAALNLKCLFFSNVPRLANELRANNFLLVDAYVAMPGLRNDAVLRMGCLHNGGVWLVGMQGRHGEEGPQFGAALTFFAGHHYLAQPKKWERF